MLKFLSSLLFSLFFLYVYGQNLPIIDEEAWVGLADLSRNIIVEPQFQEIKYVANSGLIRVKKRNLWGLINDKGDVLIEPKYKSISILNAYHRLDERGNIIEVPKLYKLIVNDNDQVFYIHPDYPKSSYTAYKDLSKAIREIDGAMISPIIAKNHLVRVAKPNNTINFLDSTGVEVLVEDVYDGDVLNPYFFYTRNKEKKRALFSIEGKQLSDYNYKYLYPISTGKHIKATREYTLENGRTENRVTLLDLNGKEIFKPGRLEVYDNLVVMNTEEKGTVYTLDGDLVFEYEGYTIEKPRDFKEDQFLIRGTAKVGLINKQGNLILDTLYKNVQVGQHGRYVFTDLNNTSGVLDSNFNRILEMDYAEITPDVKGNSGYFQVRADTGYPIKRGLVDSLGKVIVPLRYREIRFIGKCNLIKASAQRDSMSLYNFAGKEVYPLNPSQRNVQCDDAGFYFISKDSIQHYSLTGEFIGTKEFRRQQRQTRVDQNGREYPDTEYSFFSNNDAKTGRYIYFGRRKNQKTPETHLNVIFNDKGREISPSGYALPENYTYNKTGETGGIRVAHREDYLSQAEKPRQGIINFEGEWIVKPDRHLIFTIGSELYAIGKYDDMSFYLYDREGKKISEQAYDFFERDSNEKIHNNRLVVGKILDKKDYLNNLEQIRMYQDFRLAMEKYRNMEKPNYRMGYIDIKGNEISNLTYIEADPFIYQYTTVSGKDKEGNTYASIIDLNNKTLLKTNYDRLRIMPEDSTLVVAIKEDKKGIIDLNGKVLIQATNQEVQYNSGLFTSADTTAVYLYVGGDKKIKIGDPGDSWRIEKISELLYVMTVTTRNKTSPYITTSKHVFDKDGNNYEKLSEKLTGPQSKLAQSIYGLDLPEGFIAVFSARNEPPYVIDWRNGKEFRLTE